MSRDKKQAEEILDTLGIVGGLLPEGASIKVKIGGVYHTFDSTEEGDVEHVHSMSKDEGYTASVGKTGIPAGDWSDNE